MPYYVAQSGQAILSRFPILGPPLRPRFPTRATTTTRRTSGVARRHRARLFGAPPDLRHFEPAPPVPQGLRQQRPGRTGDRRTGAQQPYPAQQVREIRAVIDSTHYPVILAGDFNDTPSSYTYRRLTGAT
ncbi:MAG: endonuclease/exonuclease/phosphatase family protein [Alistipes shahii]